MQEAIPELMSANAFEPADLALMQSVFEEACRVRGADDRERKAALATVILGAYATGERDRRKLLAAAAAVVM